MGRISVLKGRFSNGNERAESLRRKGAAVVSELERRDSDFAAENAHAVRVHSAKPPSATPHVNRERRVAPPSSTRTYVKQLSGDLSKPQHGTGREVLILLAVVAAIAFVYWGYEYFTRPPELGRMSERNLRRHVNKVRSMLALDAAVLVGSDSEDRLDIYVYPFSGDKPFYLDKSSGFSVRTPSPPYEPSFTYWRLSFKLAPLMQIINDFISAVSENGFVSAAAYSLPKQSISDRFIIDLFDFGIFREPDLGIQTQHTEGEALPHILPSPSGNTLYLVSASRRFPSEYRFKVATKIRSPKPSVVSFYADRSRWTGGADDESKRYLMSEPQPYEGGLIAFVYEVKSDAETNAEAIVSASVVKLGIPDSYKSILSHDGGEGVEVWTDNFNKKLQFECSLEELVRIDAGTNRVTSEVLRGFVSFYFDERNEWPIGYLVNQGEQGNYIATLVYYKEAEGFIPIANIRLATQMFLVDYQHRYLFIMSGEKPLNPGEAAEVESNEDVESDGEQIAGATPSRPQRPSQSTYWLNKLDLSTMELTPIRKLKASKRVSMYGNGYTTVPILTLSVQQKRIVTTDGSDLVLLDYDGNLIKTLETDDKMSYGMLYAVNKLDGAAR